MDAYANSMACKLLHDKVLTYLTEVLNMKGCSWIAGEARVPVPQGRLTIAQHFSAGSQSPPNFSVP